MTAADVLVAGAGPGGCTAALALAAQGASVRVVDPQLPYRRVLSGEWLHPGGVAALTRLGVELHGPDFLHQRGFLCHPGDGSPPIELAYPQGTAVSMPHATLRCALHQALADRPGVDLGPPDRLIDTSPHGSVRTSRGLLRAGLVVGADGRSSAVRAALLRHERLGTGRRNCKHDTPSVPLSHMAAMLLPETALPVEGIGHIFLGGPGPILAYRITADTVRLCLDVPLGHPRAPRLYDYLRHAYARALPRPLRDGCLNELAKGRVQWAVNRFRRRLCYGHGRHVLVGDAVGYGHPLAALGMTMATLDGECLGRHAVPAVYARQRARRSWAAERVAAAVHRALTAQDPASLALRGALFTLWRDDVPEGQRMMALLGGLDDNCYSLALRVVRIARTAAENAPLPVLPALGAWLYWLAGPGVGVPPQRKSADRVPNSIDR
jgi:squalene monooxygenase